LESIQNKFERFAKIEKHIFEQESVLNNLEKKVNEMEASMKDKDDIINDLAEKLKARKETTKVDTVEKRIYVLEKRRLGSDLCDFCDEEFKAGCEKDRKEKETHIRDTHTFECNVCKYRNKTKIKRS
jgi:uncharacterized coiled-coil protein SlyX